MRQSLKFVRKPLVAAMAGLVMGTPVAFAQSGGLDEVVVTAQFREENLQDTPIAITAVTAEDIEVRALNNAADIGYTIPNASFRPAQAAYGNSMTAFIRGIGQNDFNFAFEPGVGIYIDDVYFPTVMGSLTDLMDLERVEVLRGPQGTLFGRGSIGGAVRFVTKKPQGDQTGNVQVTYGEFDRVDVRGSYDFAISENLFARVAGAVKHRKGYQTVLDFTCVNPVGAGIGDGLAADGTTGPADGLPDVVAVGSAEDLAAALSPQDPNRANGCKLGTLGNQDQYGARAAVRWVATDDLEFTFSADYADDEGSTPNTLLAVASPTAGPFAGWSAAQAAQTGVPYDSRFIAPDIYTSYATFDDPNTGLSFEKGTYLEQWGVSGDMSWSFAENMSLDAIIAYREYDSYFANDHDASPLNEQLVNGNQHFESFTGELRLSGRLADRLDYTVGYFHYDGEVISAQVVSLPPFQAPGALFLVNGYNTGEFENNSVFAHLIYDLTDDLSLTVGGRYSEDKKVAHQDNTIVILDLDTKNSHWDYRVGLDYKIGDNSLVYASTATGYRPQAYNPRPFQPSQFVQVDGEEATSYEIGFKSDFLDGSLRTNIAAFYIDYSNRIVGQGGSECLKNADGTIIQPPANPATAVADPEGSNVLCNTTSKTNYVNFPGKSYGVELEAIWRPTDQFMLTGIFGLTEWKSDDVDTNTAAVNNRPPYVPKLNWSIGASYEFAMPNGGSLTPRLDVYGQSKICTNLTAINSCSDGYEILNGRIEYASPDSDWTLAVGATNLADKEYILNRFDLTAFGQMTVEGQPGRPREWYVTLGHKF